MKVVMVFFCFVYACYAQVSSPYVANKKVIEIGWDLPSASFVKNNIATMEKQPFDGIVFAPGKDVPHIFNPMDWSKSRVVDLDTLKAIKWSKFTDNFLLLYSADNWNMQYFNDSQWRTICANMRLLARAARLGGCKGLVFDTEFYSKKSPWAYADHKEGHDSLSVVNMARKRGGQVMAAMQAEFPDIKILFAVFLCQSDLPRWELSNAFGNGMLDSLNHSAVLIEGLEGTYYWLDTYNWFFRSYYTDRQDLLKRVDPKNRAKCNSQVQVARALYGDFNYRYVPEGTIDSMSYKKKHWEHTVYASLATTDEYAWLYCEHMDWWNNKKDQAMRSNNPNKLGPPWPGVIEGLASARTKYRNAQRLGWDLIHSSGIIDSAITVNLISPANGATFKAPAKITLTAKASGGTINQDLVAVDFYCNTQVIGSTKVKPDTYSINLENVPAGTYTFFAITLTPDAHGTSGPVTITVKK